MEFHCSLCGYRGETAPLYPRRQICRCPRCRLAFYAGDGYADPATLYTPEYFAGAEYRDYVADKKLIQRDFADRVEVVRRLKPAGRLLEIGCAYGFFLELARAHWEVRGLDVAGEAVAHARGKLGLNAEHADFLALPEEPAGYDVICMWDTLEHLPRPVECIRRAARWLKPGGVLAVTTNDIDSRLARLRKARWRQIHPPTHLFYFSADTLRMAVEQAGLQTLDVDYVGYHRSFRSMAHAVFTWKGPRTAWLYEVVTLGGRIDFPVYLNLRDIMMLTARKPARRARRPAGAGGDRPRGAARAAAKA